MQLALPLCQCAMGAAGSALNLSLVHTQKRRCNVFKIAYLVTKPLFFIGPVKLVRLGVVISQFGVLAIDHLFDLSQRYTVSLGAERNHALEKEMGTFMFESQQKKRGPLHRFIC